MTRLRLIRHATLLVELGGVRFLVDPMLGEPGSIPAIPNTPNQRLNPLVPLPDVPLDHDAVVVTHRHRDHFDDAARETLATDVPLFCQPDDEGTFREDGFADVRPVDNHVEFEGVRLSRTPARHGHGQLAEEMGPVSGFVLDAEESVYLAGDTVWYDGVAETLDRYEPDVVVVNAGAAQFVEGDPITMDVEDVRAVREHVAPEVPVVAVHAEAINHCLLSRSDLSSATTDVLVPDDGEDVPW